MKPQKQFEIYGELHYPVIQDCQLFCVLGSDVADAWYGEYGLLSEWLNMTVMA